MDRDTPASALDLLLAIQLEYEGLCRKAWMLRADADPQHQAELDREVSAVMRRVEQVYRTQPLRRLYS